MYLKIIKIVRDTKWKMGQSGIKQVYMSYPNFFCFLKIFYGTTEVVRCVSDNNILFIFEEKQWFIQGYKHIYWARWSTSMHFPQNFTVGWLLYSLTCYSEVLYDKCLLNSSFHWLHLAHVFSHVLYSKPYSKWRRSYIRHTSIWLGQTDNRNYRQTASM